MEILRIQSLECGYKFKCKYQECIFYFTVTPGSCCPPFYSKNIGLNVEIDKIGQKINNITELINETINDKIIRWMEHTQYNPHDDNLRKSKILNSFFDKNGAIKNDRNHYKNYKIMTTNKKFNFSKLDLSSYNLSS